MHGSNGQPGWHGALTTCLDPLAFNRMMILRVIDQAWIIRVITRHDGITVRARKGHRNTACIIIDQQNTHSMRANFRHTPKQTCRIERHIPRMHLMPASNVQQHSTGIRATIIPRHTARHVLRGAFRYPVQTVFQARIFRCKCHRHVVPMPQCTIFIAQTDIFLGEIRRPAQIDQPFLNPRLRIDKRLIRRSQNIRRP